MGKVLKIAMGSVAGLVGLTWIGLQTPYVAPASEIIKSSWDGISDCLRIKKREPGDVTYRNVRNLSVRQESFKFSVEGDSGTFQGSIGWIGRIIDPQGLKLNSNQKNHIRNCKSNIKNFGLYEITSIQNRECKMSTSSFRSQDIFFQLEDNVPVKYLTCAIDRQNNRKKNCSYQGKVQNWKMLIFFPYEHIEDWRKVGPAVEAKFNQSFEPLGFCPLRVPFI